ncbi:hypothetical protein E5288_WYG005601 [Bos mutus]|uniref:Uncharacterized protein n=1 Tax=Bos mutus TaxID=72004 RepID=A0A6B0RLS7_9CETA|nr:hypothetical protein [Bos mutus]
MTPGIPMATAASSLLQLPTGHKEVPHPPRKALVRFNCTENILLKSFPMLTTVTHCQALGQELQLRQQRDDKAGVPDPGQALSLQQPTGRGKASTEPRAAAASDMAYEDGYRYCGHRPKGIPVENQNPQTLDKRLWGLALTALWGHEHSKD